MKEFIEKKLVITYEAAQDDYSGASSDSWNQEYSLEGVTFDRLMVYVTRWIAHLGPNWTVTHKPDQEELRKESDGNLCWNIVNKYNQSWDWESYELRVEAVAPLKSLPNPYEIPDYKKPAYEMEFKAGTLADQVADFLIHYEGNYERYPWLRKFSDLYEEDIKKLVLHLKNLRNSDGAFCYQDGNEVDEDDLCSACDKIIGIKTE